MKKNIILIVSILICGTLFSQVGVDTRNPQGVFNIDGGKDNPKTGSAHTEAQQLNDHTVLANGNVGLGTINPTAKLEVQTGGTSTSPVPGFKLVDGTQGTDGAVLTSNAAGVAKWSVLASSKGAILGAVDGANRTVSSDGGGNKYLYYKIDLPQGNWVVNVGLKLENTLSPFALGDGTWVHGYLSSNTTTPKVLVGYKPLGGDNAGYAAALFKNSSPNSPNFFAGTMAISVTAPTVTLYLILENFGRLGAANSGSLWVHKTDNVGNYFYAVPVNN